jgi:myosin-crossreactive antigen
MSINNQQNHHGCPVNHLFIKGAKSLKALRAKRLRLNFYSQTELIKLMLKSKEALYDKRIANTFHADFFAVKF